MVSTGGEGTEMVEKVVRGVVEVGEGRKSWRSLLMDLVEGVREEGRR